MTTPVVPCLGCVHFLGGVRCTAFPAGIPEEILWWKHDHREPYPGDNGIRYEPKPITGKVQS